MRIVRGRTSISYAVFRTTCQIISAGNASRGIIPPNASGKNISESDVSPMIELMMARWENFFPFVLIFILLFIQLHLSPIIKNTLLKLGDYSMPMWMIHTFFSAYLFHEFIYGFKYPLLIYLALIIISYLIAIPVMMISKKIIKIARI